MLTESFSGIRGIFGKEFTLDAAKKYAYVFSEFIKKKSKKKILKLVIGMDTRPSSEAVKKAVLEVLEGEIIDVGYASTPAEELAVRHYQADGGIMITASHNEPQFNGFKFLDNDGGVLRAKDAEKVIDLYRTIKNRKIKLNKNSKIIINNHKNLQRAYVNFVFDLVGRDEMGLIRKSGFKVIIDPNGGSGAIAYDVLRNAGIDVMPFNMEQGRFKRIIEPNEKSLSYLRKHIKRYKADLAAGFDCDADRVEILDDKGNMLNGHVILALLIDSVFSNVSGKNKTAVINDATSNLVKEIAKKHKAKVIEVEVGEANVVEAMDRLKSPVGGEGSSSGGILPPSKCRDGILTLMMILSLMAQRKKNLSEILKGYPPYFEARTRLAFNPKKHDFIKRALVKYYGNKKYKLQQLGGIKGGLKVVTDPKSFVYFRASKTEGGQFRIIVNSDNKKRCNDLLKEAVAVFNKAV